MMNTDALQPSSNGDSGNNPPLNPSSTSNPTAAAHAAPTTSTIGPHKVVDDRRPQDHILPPPPRSSPGPSNIESQGNDAIRRRVQVLTKDELKDLLKARNLAGPGIAKRTKDGEYWCFLSTSIILT
jgi:hypothetical protein